MYNCNDMYLYEILEDYKYAEDISEKDAIFDAFCSALWSCGNNRTRMTKTIRYRVEMILSILRQERFLMHGQTLNTPTTVQ